jgi:N-acetylglucosaminyl-diphospho-decaprenol L-rhamnosyltransferase
MSPTAADVAAVVVNYNAGATLAACVARLRAEGVGAIVVVDNDSGDGSAEAAAAPDVRLVRAGANLGYGTAANIGVATASQPYVLVMNPDVEVRPGSVDALVGALERDPLLAVVGPRVESPDGSLYPSARRFPDLVVAAGHAFLWFVAPDNRFSRAYKLLDWDHATPGEVDWVSGSCMLVRRDAFGAVGGFDERYFMYVEDVDLCWRLGRAGWRIGYEPASRVVHAGGVSTDQAAYRMILEHHRSLWRFARETTVGARRLALPAVAAGLGARTVLAWAQRTLETARTRLDAAR